MIDPYFESKDFTLYLGDAIEIINQFDKEYFDLIFADPPYFLSNDGIIIKINNNIIIMLKNYLIRISGNLF